MQTSKDVLFISLGYWKATEQSIFTLLPSFTCHIKNVTTGKQSKTQLSAAIRYVDEHYADSGLSLNEVAREVNISPSYLSAMFSKENKTTFVEYMTSKRMEHAKKMLLTTREKSQTIAEQVGYKDPHYFSYIFKKTYGLSPKEFRAKGQQGA